MDAADRELWTTLAARLELDAEAESQWPEFRRHLDRVAACVELMRGFESQRTTRRHRRRRVNRARKLANHLLKGLQALPEEFFSPRYDRQFLDRLTDDLRALEWLADDALGVLRSRKQPDPQAQRYDVIGSAVAVAYVALAGKQPTCYTQGTSGKTVGSFRTFLEVIAERVGIPRHEVSAITESRWTRHRSPYASVRRRAGKS